MLPHLLLLRSGCRCMLLVFFSFFLLLFTHVSLSFSLRALSPDIFPPRSTTAHSSASEKTGEYEASNHILVKYGFGKETGERDPLKDKH